MFSTRNSFDFIPPDLPPTCHSGLGGFRSRILRLRTFCPEKVCPERLYYYELTNPSQPNVNYSWTLVAAWRDSEWLTRLSLSRIISSSNRYIVSSYSAISTAAQAHFSGLETTMPYCWLSYWSAIAVSRFRGKDDAVIASIIVQVS